jgi:protein phosphatase
LEEAENHEDKNIILRALGTQGQVEVEISDFFPVRIGDEFLLCSDGLCDMLTDEEIAEIWFTAADIHTASQNLIEETKNKGAEDNITVGIIRVGAKSEAVPAGNIKKTRELKRLEI